MSEIIALPAILNRLDKLIERLDRLAAALEVQVGITPPTVPEVTVPAPTVIVERLNNRYLIFDLDTSVAREDQPLGLKNTLLKYGVEYARYMTILDVGGGFSYKLNSTDQPSLTAQVGAEHIFEISEIYITNSASAGTARIFVEFRVD